jgi:hypothetical protein
MTTPILTMAIFHHATVALCGTAERAYSPLFPGPFPGLFEGAFMVFP